MHLSRRARGLPFWFSLAVHGTDAYRVAIETTLDVAHRGADLIRERDGFELVTEPELSILVFRRVGWTAEDYDAWSDAALESGFAFCLPSSTRARRSCASAWSTPRPPSTTSPPSSTRWRTSPVRP